MAAAIQATAGYGHRRGICGMVLSGPMIWRADSGAQSVVP
jgi:hypothetical protein